MIDYLDLSWKRFSLRALFAVTTVCCLLLGVWSIYVNPYRLQARSLAVADRLQGESVVVPAQGPLWQKRLVSAMLGRDAFVRVESVNLAEINVDDATLRALAGLTQLTELNLDRTSITDQATSALRPMRHLSSLSLRFTNISDQSAQNLDELTELKTLNLTSTKLTDAAIPDLAKLKALEELFIRWTRISDSGARQLRLALPNCAVYHHGLEAPTAENATAAQE